MSETIRVGSTVAMPCTTWLMTVVDVADGAVRCAWMAEDGYLQREWLPREAVRVMTPEDD